MRKSRPTYERHVELGAELKATRDRLQTLAVEVANAYPKQSREARSLLHAVNALDVARSALDNASCSEHPDRWTGDEYYPGSARDDEEKVGA